MVLVSRPARHGLRFPMRPSDPNADRQRLRFAVPLSPTTSALLRLSRGRRLPDRPQRIYRMWEVDSTCRFTVFYPLVLVLLVSFILRESIALLQAGGVLSALIAVALLSNRLRQKAP